MSSKLIFFVIVHFIFHEITSEPLLSNDNPPGQGYSSNTPFSSESEMESFIRNEWRDYPTIDIQPLIHPLKEILHSSFNLNQTKIRVCNEMPFSAYKDHLFNFSEPDQIYVITPSSLVPLKYFKWSMELMTMLNDISDKLHGELAMATKKLDTLDKNGDSEIVKFIKNCQGVVVVPHLFKSNYCIISPMIESFPALATVSLIKLGTMFLRYTSVKTLIQADFHQTLNNTWSELENIPISKDEKISFENFQTMVENFQNKHNSFYLKTHDEYEQFDETDVPLSHWTIVYNSLSTNVSNYLKWIMSRNGSKEYENLPWIGYRMNVTKMDDDIVSIPLPTNVLTSSKSNSNDLGITRDSTKLVSSSTYFSPTEESFSHLNVFDETDFNHLYHYNNETVLESASNHVPIDDFDNSFHSEESTNLNEEKSMIGGRSGLSHGLHGPVVGQIAQSKARRNQPNPIHKYQHIINAQSQIQHHNGSFPGFNSNRSTFLRNPRMKKVTKNGKNSPNRRTDVSQMHKKNRNPMVGLFGPMKKNEIRNGRLLVPVSDHLVTSVRNDGIETSTSFNDNLVEEIQTTFESLRE